MFVGWRKVYAQITFKKIKNLFIALLDRLLNIEIWLKD